MNRTDMKLLAQDQLMHGIGNALGYIRPSDFEDWPKEQQEAYREIMQREANRLAKVFGYGEAWAN